MNPAIIASACREKQLLACCARSCVGPEVGARVREIVGRGVDWEYTLAQAHEHSVLPLVERNLRACANDLVPAEIGAQLQESYRANALRCLAQTSELLRVVALLESRGIHALPYKGPVIAAQAYRDIAARQFEDLDIILQQRDIQAADSAVRGLGYEPKFPGVHGNGASFVPGEYNYFHAARQIILELHTEATLRHFPTRPHLAELFDRAVSVDLGGKGVRTFRAEDALPVYCIHGAKDFWDRLVWIADVAELLRSCPDLDWDLTWRTAESLRAERMVHLGLALADDILDAKIPPEALRRIHRDRRASSLATELGKRLVSRGARERTARERFRYRRQTVPGLAAGWRYAIRLTLAPSEQDWEQAKLPRSLAPIHAVLRPFRLLRKYGR